jgi:N-acetylmuramoyl-L-alanine amidase
MNAGAVAIAAALLVAAACVPHAATALPAAATAPVVRVAGVPCVGASDLARLLDGSLWWRSDTRKLVMLAQGHRITFTTDAPIVLFDDRTVRIDAPVRSVGGELQVPVSFLALLPRDSTAVRLSVDAGGTRVRALPAEGWVGVPHVVLAGALTRISLASSRADEARVTSRARAHFRVWLPGVASGADGDTLPERSLVLGRGRVAGGDGVTWEFLLDPSAATFRIAPGPGGLVIELARGPQEGFEPLASEGPRALRVIVLDPGHGGADAGAAVPGALEKDLALQFARLLAPELERRTGAQVVLTRDSDRDLSQLERAEAANRARADLVISLHFDGAPLTRARGATVWCAPLAEADEPFGFAAGGLSLTPWRDVALRHAVASRALADDVSASLAARGLGPVRVRERLPVALLGVQAPGVSLECATLTSADDLARVRSADGLRALASAVADGVLAWGRP